MDLVVVESPTKAKTLSGFLGKKYKVEATMGHIKDLPKSKLGIDVENDFKPLYQELPKRLDVIKKLSSDSRKAETVYIATDPDREGEAIAHHVSEIIKNDNYKRITFHEITKEAVEHALAHPLGINKNLVNAQIGRRVLDRLVGYELSPLLWKKIRRGLSAGRVQSVAVRLIVEREKEIQEFKPEEYWQIFVDVQTPRKEEITLELIGVKVKDRESAEEVVSYLNRADYVVDKIRRREVRKRPYAPFTTSTMTQSAAVNFGWSAKRTMRAAQSLYEEGLITYHRTDSHNLNADFVGRARNFIKDEYGQKYLPSSPIFYKTTSKSAQEAHEAIRPTDLDTKRESKLTGDLLKLYQLVWRRFIACQMADCVFDQTTIDVSGGKYKLRAGGQTMKFDGWRKIMPREGLNDVVLPRLEEGEKLGLVGVRPVQKFTQPPARYNEASIVKTLEKLGIGRPSTYAPIISTIQARQYVEKKDGKFYATPVGIAVTEFLLKNFPQILDYQFTAQMEDDLDRVAEGKRDWVSDIKSFYEVFHSKLAEVTDKSERVPIPTEKIGEKCPQCGKGDLVIRIGRFGKFISCSDFPSCKYVAKYVEKIGMKCPKCGNGDVIIKRTAKGRKFFGCSRYPDCDYASWRSPKPLEAAE